MSNSGKRSFLKEVLLSSTS